MNILSKAACVWAFIVGGYGLFTIVRTQFFGLSSYLLDLYAFYYLSFSVIFLLVLAVVLESHRP